MEALSDDPLYGLRILAAAKSPLIREALWQYEHWPPKDRARQALRMRRSQGIYE